MLELLVDEHYVLVLQAPVHVRDRGVALLRELADVVQHSCVHASG